MYTFKSPHDLNKLPADDPAHNIIKELIEDLISAYTWEGHPYNPDWYGFILLVCSDDVDRKLDELWDGCRLTNIPWALGFRFGAYTCLPTKLPRYSPWKVWKPPNSCPTRVVNER